MNTNETRKVEIMTFLQTFQQINTSECRNHSFWASVYPLKSI